MRGIYARINRLDGAVDAAATHFTPNHVLAFVQQDFLLQLERVFNDSQDAIYRCFFLRFIMRGRHTKPELLVATWAFENQTPARSIFRFVEQNRLITFRTAYAFHRRDSN